jgi:hypothetical protein
MLDLLCSLWLDCLCPQRFEEKIRQSFDYVPASLFEWMWKYSY